MERAIRKYIIEQKLGEILEHPSWNGPVERPTICTVKVHGGQRWINQCLSRMVYFLKSRGIGPYIYKGGKKDHLGFYSPGDNAVVVREDITEDPRILLIVLMHEVSHYMDRQYYVPGERTSKIDREVIAELSGNIVCSLLGIDYLPGSIWGLRHDYNAKADRCAKNARRIAGISTRLFNIFY